MILDEIKKLKADSDNLSSQRAAILNELNACEGCAFACGVVIGILVGVLLTYMLMSTP